MDWKPHAERLAAEVTHPVSRWRPAVAAVPRHVFVPRWWRHLEPEGWTLRDGAEDPGRWMRAAYSDRSLVTRAGPLHADHATPDDHPQGRPTSSSTEPGLVVRMLRHGMIPDGADVLDVATGSGYSAALLTRRLGTGHVTSVDVDPYLTEAATDRLDSLGLRAEVAAVDATGALPGTYDRIVSMVSVPRIPASWLTALRPGGRLVTTLADTGLILTADKTDDGGAEGRIEWDRAGFMTTRHGHDYPTVLVELFITARDEDGETVSTSPYPVIDVQESWEVWSTLSLTAPGIGHRYQRDDDGTRTAWMAHPDGSWARATGHGADPATVHQGGPRRLWDELDRIRMWWLADGTLNTYGARAVITPDGITTLTRGGWNALL